MPLGPVPPLRTERELPAYGYLLGTLQPATVLSIFALPDKKYQFLYITALNLHLSTVTQYQNILCSTGHTGISSNS